MRSATLPPDLAHDRPRGDAQRRRPHAPARTARILGLGHHVPPEVVPNGPIAERIGVDDAWIVKRTGIKSRRRALPGERLTDYAAFAGRRALADAGVDPRDVDLVLVATMTPDEITPNAAPVVANALGAEQRRRDRHRRRLHRLARRAAPGRRPGRDRPRRPRAGDRRRAAHAHHRLRRSQDRDAVRRRRRRGARRPRGRGRHRPDRAGRRRRAGRPHHRHHEKR